MIDLQQDCFIHSMNKGINSLYFSDKIYDTAYGYTFYAKHSKVKNNIVVYRDRIAPDSDGEIIKSSKESGFSKASEIIYYIPDIFDRSLYENRKKYQNRVLSPEVLIKKLNINIRVATEDDLPSITTLHNDWCRKKLENPTTHRISFSSTRYLRCVTSALNKEGFVVIVAEQEGKIVGCRVVTVDNKFLFDAAFFVEFWNQSQLSEAVNIASMRFFQTSGYEYINTGLASGTLKAYKQHFPHTEVFVYRKSQIVSTLENFF